jgi:hypothetical protein
VQAGDGGLSWSQPKRAPEAEVILDLGKQLGLCDGSHNSRRSRDTDCCGRDLNCTIALPPRPQAIVRSFIDTAFTATRSHPAAAFTHLPRATFMRPRVLSKTHRIHCFASATRSTPATAYRAHNSR